MEQITNGMQLYGMLEHLRSTPWLSMKLFNIQDEACLSWTFEEFSNSIFAEYSAEGSNRRMKEIDVFKLFLDTMELVFNDGKSLT